MIFVIFIFLYFLTKFVKKTSWVPKSRMSQPIYFLNHFLWKKTFMTKWPTHKIMIKKKTHDLFYDYFRGNEFQNHSIGPHVRMWQLWVRPCRIRVYFQLCNWCTSMSVFFYLVYWSQNIKVTAEHIFIFVRSEVAQLANYWFTISYVHLHIVCT